MRTQAIRPRRVHDFVSSIFDYDLHAKRVASLANATVGALQGARLAVGAIGRALAVAKDLDPKHAIKQVDRFFSNTGVDVWTLFASWVPYVIGTRPEILVAIDWTDYDPDNQSTIAIYLVTKHGRATPLIWKTVKKSTMQGWRNEYEDQVIERLHEVLPADVKVTVLADRGFGDQKFYELLKDQLGFDFVVRFRGVIKVTSAEGETKSALAWTPNNGRSLLLRGARVTREGRQLGGVVCLKAKGMKDAWHLATSFGDKPAAEVVNLYSRRFTIEESFRDMRNLRFGMGLSDTRIGSPERRDRILLVGAVAAALLTLLGAAGEAVGLDRRMKANTSKERTHSLLNQGLFYFDWLLTMRDERALPLVQAFDELVRNQATFREMLGVI